MSDTFIIDVKKREEGGTSVSRRLRRNGQIPAIVYGHGKAGLALTLSADYLVALLANTGLVNINVAGRKRQLNAILKEVQRHPISGNVLHLDFQEVKADEVITTMLAIEPHGQAAGEHAGGVMQQMAREVEVQCLPANMPEILIVEISGMELDDTLYVSDLIMPEGVTVTTDSEQPVFQVRMPRIEAEAEPEEGAEGTVGAEGEAGAEGEEGATENASEAGGDK